MCPQDVTCYSVAKLLYLLAALSLPLAWAIQGPARCHEPACPKICRAFKRWDPCPCVMQIPPHLWWLHLHLHLPQWPLALPPRSEPPLAGWDPPQTAAPLQRPRPEYAEAGSPWIMAQISQGLAGQQDLPMLMQRRQHECLEERDGVPAVVCMSAPWQGFHGGTQAQAGPDQYWQPPGQGASDAAEVLLATWNAPSLGCSCWPLFLAVSCS